jgi:cytochrome c oxidase subunit 1
MSSVAAAGRVNYFNVSYSLGSWLTPRDHKRIAILFAFSITAFFFAGAVAAAMIRLNLLTPAGALVSAETYNKLFTLHGVVMVWFFLIPSIPATFGNFLIPMMIGAKDLAFPRLNLASWYLYTLGGLFVLWALIAGGVDTGWTFYSPYTTMFSNSQVVAAVAGVFIVGFSSIFTGINFIVTVHRMRAPGLTWFRLPLFVWANYATNAGPQAPEVTLLFYLYFVMTGLHALHLLIGLGVLAVMVLLSHWGRFGPAYHTPIELAGLYWHFVDLVWIFLYHLFYLVARG